MRPLVEERPAGRRLVAALLVLLGLGLAPRSLTVVASCTVLGLVVALGLAARIALRRLGSRIALALPFSLGVAGLALFQPDPLASFVVLAARTTASIAVLQLVVLTTPFARIVDALRRARLPRALVDTVSLLHRYLGLVASEMHRMRRARAARTWDDSRRETWRAGAAVIAGSFVRSLARAERVALAMRARGGS